MKHPFNPDCNCLRCTREADRREKQREFNIHIQRRAQRSKALQNHALLVYETDRDIEGEFSE